MSVGLGHRVSESQNSGQSWNTQEKEDPCGKGGDRPVGTNRALGKGLTVFREKRLGEAVFALFASLALVWTVSVSTTGMLLCLFPIFDICVSHRCQTS